MMRKALAALAVTAAAGCSFSASPGTADYSPRPPGKATVTTPPEYTTAGDAAGGHRCTAKVAFADSSATVQKLARDTGMWLPDPSCTPGAVNPAVRQNNIQSTICHSGWTATVRPPVSYTEPLKLQGIHDYGYTDTHASDYEEDHLIPLELGGSPTDPRNLWPEPDRSPNLKDTIEAALNAAVCLGHMPLAEAQHEIATRWPSWA